MNIDFSKKYTITSTIEDADAIVNLLDPKSYARLFVDNEIVDELEENMITAYMSEENAAMFRDYKKTKNSLKNMEKCTKNLASLAVLYKSILDNYQDMKNGACQLELNTMQAYELHITLVVHMRKSAIELSEKENELDEKFTILNVDERDKILKLHHKVNTLKALNLSLINIVGRETLYAIEEIYDNISPEQHMKYCIM